MRSAHAARLGSSRLWLERLLQGPSGRLPTERAGCGGAGRDDDGFTG